MRLWISPALGKVGSWMKILHRETARPVEANQSVGPAFEWFNKCPYGQRQKFIGAVADNNILRLASMELRQFFPQQLRGGCFRYQADPAIHGTPDGFENLG